jgi:hypothetical protein
VIGERWRAIGDDGLDVVLKGLNLFAGDICGTRTGEVFAIFFFGLPLFRFGGGVESELFIIFNESSIDLFKKDILYNFILSRNEIMHLVLRQNSEEPGEKSKQSPLQF